MKRYNPGGDMALLGQLSKYFLLDPRELTYIQKIEMLAIYKYLAGRLGNTDPQIIIKEVDRIRITLRIRGRKRSLYHVFYYCKAKHMQEHGDYDTDTLRPPAIPKIENYY